MAVYLFACSGVYGYLASLHRYDWGYGTDLTYVICAIAAVVSSMVVGMKLPPHNR